MSTYKNFAALALLCVVAPLAAAPAKNRPQAATDAPVVLSPAVVFAAWDSDKNKQLSPEEFNAGWARMERIAALRQLKAQFDRHDANKNSALDAAEYAALALIRNAGASAPPIARFDGDKSGGLDFKEYVALVAALGANNGGAAAPAQVADAPAK
ncbi:EF-hand domain-containing protein [Lysobacter terrae]